MRNYLKIVCILQIFLKKEDKRKSRGTKLSSKTNRKAIEKNLKFLYLVPISNSNFLFQIVLCKYLNRMGFHLYFKTIYTNPATKFYRNT